MAKQKKGKTKICGACGKTFYIPFYRVETARFCSKNCLNHEQYKHYEKECKWCGKKFDVSASRKDRFNFCGLECYVRSREKYKNQKEFRRVARQYVIAKRGRNSSRNTRIIAFHHYKKECSVCGYEEYEFCLDVHHKDENPDNNLVENLLVLCVFCHRKLHRGMVTLDMARERKHKA